MEDLFALVSMGGNIIQAETDLGIYVKNIEAHSI